MAKDTKVLIAAIGFTFLAIVGFALLLGGKHEDGATYSEVQGVDIIPAIYELGDVPIDGGIVTKEYEVKNTTGEVIKLKKITTSCMCTEAKVVVGDKETRFFGMEHPGDRNPPVNFEIKSDEIAKVIVNFDPAAHGPQGIGPFERTVQLTFSDPAGIKELKFEGTVVAQ